MTAEQIIEPTAAYAAFYIENLRTGAARQYAIIAGSDIEKIKANSTEPRRLRFERLS